MRIFKEFILFTIIWARGISGNPKEPSPSQITSLIILTLVAWCHISRQKLGFNTLRKALNHIFTEGDSTASIEYLPFKYTKESFLSGTRISIPVVSWESLFKIQPDFRVGNV